MTYSVASRNSGRGREDTVDECSGKNEGCPLKEPENTARWDFLFANSAIVIASYFAYLTKEIINKYKRSWIENNSGYSSFEEGFELVGYASDINLAINLHVAVLRYDTDSNTVEIKEKFLRPELRRHAENVRDILLQG